MECLPLLSILGKARKPATAAKSKTAKTTAKKKSRQQSSRKPLTETRNVPAEAERGDVSDDDFEGDVLSSARKALVNSARKSSRKTAKKVVRKAVVFSSEEEEEEMPKSLAKKAGKRLLLSDDDDWSHIMWTNYQKTLVTCTSSDPYDCLFLFVCFFINIKKS